MYEKFFGLKDQAFELCTDPSFLFLSPSHARARSYLLYALYHRDGIVAITGDIGTGKSTLIRSVCAEAEADTDIVVLHQTQLDEVAFLQSLLFGMGVTIVPASKAEVLDNVRELLMARHLLGRRTMLIVDDAQNLSAVVLEELRMLADTEFESQRLLGLALVGQPGLRRTLARPDLEQLRQRIRLTHHLEPLGPGATERYVRHRLRIAGNESLLIFPPESHAQIYRYTGGVPRRINMLCDMALTAASLGKARSVTPRCIADAVVELGWEAQPLKWRARRGVRGVRAALSLRDWNPRSGVRRAVAQWPVAGAARAGALWVRFLQLGRGGWAACRSFLLDVDAAAGGLTARLTPQKRSALAAAALPLLVLPLLVRAVTVLHAAESALPAAQPAATLPAVVATAEPAPPTLAQDAVVVLASHRRAAEPAPAIAVATPPAHGSAAAPPAVAAALPVERQGRVADFTQLAAGAALRSPAWILEQPPEIYTIQILGTYKPKNLVQFAARHAPDLALASFSTPRADRDWFVLLAGHYTTLTAAREARMAMPQAVQANGPWIRKFSEVQALIRAADMAGRSAHAQDSNDERSAP